MTSNAALILQCLGQIAVMAALLLASGLCSASETAFFSLSSRQLRQWENSAAPMERLSASLMRQSNRFLTALLFSNMAVNVCYFAVSSVLALRIGQAAGALAGAATAAISFFFLLLAGEILPKSIAYGDSKRFCLLAAPFCFLLLKFLSPFLAAIDLLFVKPLTRLFAAGSRKHSLTGSELRTLLENSRRQGLIGHQENLILSEMLEFSFLKARHLMTPRVKMIAAPEHLPRQQLLRLMTKHRLTKLPVYRRDLDDIDGLIELRDLLLNPQTPPARLKKPLMFVPEQKSIESLIEEFRKQKESFAVVVDEYGGISGQITIDDIIADLLAPLHGAPQPEIQPLGPLSYRLSGDLAIHDWIDAFGIDLEQTHLTTLGGFVTALLGKMPKPGDKARWKNLTFTIESVQRHRIQSIVLELEPITESIQTDAR